MYDYHSLTNTPIKQVGTKETKFRRGYVADFNCIPLSLVRGGEAELKFCDGGGFNSKITLTILVADTHCPNDNDRR